MNRWTEAYDAEMREREAQDPDGAKWKPEVGQVAYAGTDDFPVLIEAIGWIDENGYVERVARVSYLTPAWGWISSTRGQRDGIARRVEYSVGTSDTVSASSLAPEPHEVTMARWQRDLNIGVYPPYQTLDEWREKHYSLEPAPETLLPTAAS